jgi:hypothetical protein
MSDVMKDVLLFEVCFCFGLQAKHKIWKEISVQCYLLN